MNSSTRMPLLFLGHGSPMNAIEDNQFTLGFQTIAKTLLVPSSILCISAHWYIGNTKVTHMENPKTIHDFGGFPKELYDVQYPAKGNPALAEETKRIITKTNVGLDLSWGLDHGAWSVLRRLYPKADIPVIQLSIDYSKDAAYHFDLAKELSSLRDKGVLIIGSGNIVHNLSLVDFQNFNKKDYGYDWAIEAREKISHLLQKGDYKSLIHYEKLGKAVQLAIPTPDHYLPLLYVLALQQKEESLFFFNDEMVAGSLSMTSIKIE